MDSIKNLLIKYLRSKLEPEQHKPWSEIKEGIWFGLLSMTGLAFACAGLFRVHDAETVSPSDVAIISAGILFTGVIVAFGNMRNTRLERASKTYHEEAKDLFKAAYDALEIDKETNFPINSRQNYLNCARLLMAAQRLQALIPLKADRTAAKEIEQLWRFKFNELLLSRSMYDTSENIHEKSVHPWNNRYYFFQKNRLMSQGTEDRSPISLQSLGVILRFMDWPDDMPNQVSSIPELTLEEVDSRWFDPVIGLKEYIIRKNNPSKFDDTTRQAWEEL
ncbi:MAG: hypothetical protein C9356_02555 [Oleiphilus sp.]|nr:MAG: hypothetical protein C9356_02555 [Oleiphilus sp.]